ncbi:thymidine kinase [Ruania alkalisoli]|uniref:Thymidine kinase n=1 Tax=Ruania alkalisoli TaxID=2779775 RepID=A0A7M1SSU3_9MICO|nr:thymidine kinase [Ruania alkalisoli]QOR69683.1 thymidine kinase [Ruania alkalisoli]
MAKLYFRYGAMNSGKSTGLLQAAFNYEERGQRVLLAKPAVDTKGDADIISRLGMTRRVDFLIGPGESVRDLFAAHATGQEPGSLAAMELPPVACLLVDEAQFLTGEQVEDLFRLAVSDNVPVLAYGIRTDFRTRAFAGSARLLELAHTLEELKTICRCGRKAVLTTRTVGGQVVLDGTQVAIDGQQVAYESRCGRCYLEVSEGRFG